MYFRQFIVIPLTQEGHAMTDEIPPVLMTTIAGPRNASQTTAKAQKALSTSPIGRPNAADADESVTGVGCYPLSRPKADIALVDD